MGKTFQFLLLGLLSAGMFLIDSPQQGTSKDAFAAQSTPKRVLEIIVPNNVKNHWQSVEIAILDYKLSAEQIYTINIGETFQVPGSSLSLKVDTFLPSFIMNGSQITSESNDTKNPAAYVTITDGSETVFSGWLFSLYPDAHSFHDVRYNFNLTGYIAKN